MKKRAWIALCLALCLCLAGCRAAPEGPPPPSPAAGLQSQTTLPSPAALADDPQGNAPSLDENGSYDSAQDVALYLRLYGELPGNYITKDEAEELGWSGGSVERYAPGKCIGGDSFGNREGLLPEANGRVWTECDIDTLGENGRGAKRLVYSNDGLIYYTDDHYESFRLLYPED